jgi:hypothetical protein
VPPYVLTSPSAPDGTPPASPVPVDPEPAPEVFTYRVAMIGAQGVGKTALVSQFMTSECINAYDRQRGKWFAASLTGFKCSGSGISPLVTIQFRMFSSRIQKHKDDKIHGTIILRVTLYVCGTRSHNLREEHKLMRIFWA